MAARRSLTAEILLGAWSIGKGLAVTLYNAVARPRVTQRYPWRPPQLSPRWRGRLVHRRQEDGRPRCTACLACQKACPTLAIPQIQGDDRKRREKRAANYVWDASRCLFCGLCVEACPFDAIVLGQTYRIIGESREELRFDLQALLEPGGGGREARA